MRSPVRWGNLRRTQPFSTSYGYDRGVAIDRVYVDRFIDAHRADIRGVTIEILDGRYAGEMGKGRVTELDVLDVNPTNKRATLIADLNDPDCLPREKYDCFIFTQTLHLLEKWDVAIANCWNSIREGGVLLVTTPTLVPIDRHYGPDTDFLRLTPAGLQRLLTEITGQVVTAQGFGNLTSCIGAMLGLAAEELAASEIDHMDPTYPLVAAARVMKTGSFS